MYLVQELVHWHEFEESEEMMRIVSGVGSLACQLSSLQGREVLCQRPRVTPLLLDVCHGFLNPLDHGRRESRNFILVRLWSARIWEDYLRHPYVGPF